MDAAHSDRTFAAVAHRFAAWQASRPRAVEVAWGRAGFHLLYGPFAVPELVIPPAELAVWGVQPLACLLAWTQHNVAIRALMFANLALQSAAARQGPTSCDER